MQVDYQLELRDVDNGEFSAEDTLRFCCGVTEVGGFGTPTDALDQLQEQYDQALADEEVVNEENGNMELPRGFKKPPAPTMQTVIELTRDLIADEIRDTSQAYVATTISSQTHAIAALRALKFEPMKVTGRVTLWVRKARGLRS